MGAEALEFAEMKGQFEGIRETFNAERGRVDSTQMARVLGLCLNDDFQQKGGKIHVEELARNGIDHYVVNEESNDQQQGRSVRMTGLGVDLGEGKMADEITFISGKRGESEGDILIGVAGEPDSRVQVTEHAEALLAKLGSIYGSGDSEDVQAGYISDAYRATDKMQKLLTSSDSKVVLDMMSMTQMLEVTAANKVTRNTVTLPGSGVKITQIDQSYTREYEIPPEVAETVLKAALIDDTEEGRADLAFLLQTGETELNAVTTLEVLSLDDQLTIIDKILDTINRSKDEAMQLYEAMEVKGFDERALGAQDVEVSRLDLPQQSVYSLLRGIRKDLIGTRKQIVSKKRRYVTQPLSDRRALIYNCAQYLGIIPFSSTSQIDRLNRVGTRTQ